MAVTKQQLKNLKPIKKGEVKNPLGAGAHNPIVGAVRQLTAIEVQEVGSLVLQNDLEGLQKIAKEKRASVLKVWIAACAVKAIQKGDASTLNAILDRIVGRTPSRVELTGANGRPLAGGAAGLSPEQRADEIKRLDEIAKIAGED